MKEILLDKYNPNKKKIQVYVDKEVKQKLKEGAKKRGILLKTYLNRILEKAVEIQEGVKTSKIERNDKDVS